MNANSKISSKSVFDGGSPGFEQGTNGDITRFYPVTPPFFKFLELLFLVRGVGFEPTNPYGTAASGLRL